jgi:hypothetical protein
MKHAGLTAAKHQTKVMYSGIETFTAISYGIAPSDRLVHRSPQANLSQLLPHCN